MKKVSVVVPVYNRETVVGKTIDCILMQKWENLELVLVDDGSTDDSLSVLHSYAEKDQRIVVVEKPNGGVVDAVASGIRKATGDYVCFVDSDDLVGPEFISNFMNHIGENDFIAMGYIKCYGNHRVETKLHETREYNKGELAKYAAVFLAEPGISNISNRFENARWNKLIKRELAVKVGEGYHQYTYLSLGEDAIFNYLLFTMAETGISMEEANQYYYIIEGGVSIMKSNSVETHTKKSLAVYKALSDEMAKNQQTDTQASALYYFLMKSLLVRILRSDNKRERCSLVRSFMKDELFQRGMLTTSTGSLNEKLQRIIWTVHIPGLYVLFFDTVEVIKKLKK